VYWVFINYKGKRTSRQVGSLKAATKVKENIEARLKLGQDALPKEDKPAPTVAEYYDRFKAIYLATAVREGTKSRYETSFKHHVIPFLGNVHLNHLTRERVRDFVANLVQKKISVVVKETNRDESGKAVITKKTIERSLSRPTIRIIVAQFCAMLSHAVEEKVIAVNPAVKLGKFYKQGTARRDPTAYAG
jgi:hypothetical protein